MRILYAVGTAIYYAGLLVMLVGFFTLFAGLSVSLSHTLQAMQHAAEDPQALDAAPGAQAEAIPPSGEEGDVVGWAMGGVEGAMDGVVSESFERLGLDFPAGDEYVGSLYHEIKRFYGHLLLGLGLAVAGMLLRLVDIVVTFISAHGFGVKKPQKAKVRVGLGWLRVKGGDEADGASE